MKGLAWFAAAVTLVVSGVYTVVSLARWEWSRALFFAVMFVATEVLAATGSILGRLSRVEAEVARHRSSPSPATTILASTRSDQPRFEWMRSDPIDLTTRTGVFVTLLVGGGVLLSAAAWLLDHIAARTVDPRREARLGTQLDSITYRPGLVVDEVTAMAREHPLRADPAVARFLGPRP